MQEQQKDARSNCERLIGLARHAQDEAERQKYQGAADRAQEALQELLEQQAELVREGDEIFRKKVSF